MIEGEGVREEEEGGGRMRGGVNVEFSDDYNLYAYVHTYNCKCRNVSLHLTGSGSQSCALER